MRVSQSARLDAPVLRAHEMKLFRRMVDGLEGIGGITLYGPPELEDRVAIVPFNVEGVANAIRVVEAAGLDCWGGHCTVE